MTWDATAASLKTVTGADVMAPVATKAAMRVTVAAMLIATTMKIVIMMIRATAPEKGAATGRAAMGLAATRAAATMLDATMPDAIAHVTAHAPGGIVTGVVTAVAITIKGATTMRTAITTRAAIMMRTATTTG